MISLTINKDIQLFVPSDTCCNCGSASDVEMVMTDLRHMPLWGFTGIEVRVDLPFPYCVACKHTARRKGPTPLAFLALSCLAALVLGIGWLFAGPQLSEEATLYGVAPGIVLLSLAGVVGFFRSRRPQGAQTSYYQPVKLNNTGHKWPIDLTGFELGFSNPAYAQAFVKANEALLPLKKLKVTGFKA